MADKMRAIVKAKAAPGLEMQLVDIPSIGPRDVLVKVRTASICGTDLHMSNLRGAVFSHRPPPRDIAQCDLFTIGGNWGIIEFRTCQNKA